MFQTKNVTTHLKCREIFLFLNNMSVSSHMYMKHLFNVSKYRSFYMSCLELRIYTRIMCVEAAICSYLFINACLYVVSVVLQAGQAVCSLRQSLYSR